MLMAAGMMSACNNSQKNDGRSVANDSTENVTTAALPDDETDADEEDDFVAPERGIASIKKEWAAKTLQVDGDKAKAGIKQFALAFCKAYPQCETNEAMRQYLSDPVASKKDEYSLDIKKPEYDYPFTFDMYCNPRSGFIRSMAEVETDRFTYACYWNRKDGHKLISVYMEECWESASWDQCLVVFYDYDPATGVMTPEPSLTDMIEKRMKEYNCYYLRLPEEGKDIEVIGIKFNEPEEDGPEEDWEDFNMKLKWNGSSFDWAD